MTAQSPSTGPTPNLVSIFEQQAARNPERAAALVKQEGRWQEVSWGAIAADARAFADGLSALGVQRGDRIAILGNTSLDWIRADLGVLGAGAVEVPIYQSNKPAEIAYVCHDSQVKYLICDTRAQAEKVLEVRGALPGLQGIFCFQAGGDGHYEKTVAELRELGRNWRKLHEDAHAKRMEAIRAKDPCCIIYTAGTTGDPKGVVLSHANWSYEASAIARLDVLKPSDTMLFFLPLAHVFAKVMETCWFTAGFQMAFAESVERLIDDAGEVQPTILPAVPRIFEKAFAAVVNQGTQAAGLKGRLFKMAMESFEQYAQARSEGRDFTSMGLFVGRRLVFPKLSEALRARFGKRLRFFVSGSAPLSPKIAYFFQEVGFTILEGYGLTETSAATCVNLPGKVKIGTCGPPLPGTEIKIAADGEILVKGGGVFLGYHNRPEATAEVLTPERWFSTGDIGELDRDGYLTITDRKKDIIATAGGKKIAPQNLENQLQTTPLIAHAMVHGDQRKFLSALLTLNPDAARAYAAAHGSSARSLEDLAQDPVVRAGVQQAIDDLNAKLPSYSTLKKFAILPTEFTVESGELTPKMSVRRKLVSQRFKALLDSFYTD